MSKSLKDSYYVVEFEHIDDHRCFHQLKYAFQGGEGWGTIPGDERQAEEELRMELEELFRESGWEGDGDIDCFFVPPCFCNRVDTYCDTIFHVKQGENGISWLAIPRGFRFEMSEQFSQP